MSEKNRPQTNNDDLYEVPRDKGDTNNAAAKKANEVSSAQPTDRPNSYSEWTLEQLLERAEELDLEGRSDMDKPELLAALSGMSYGDQS